MVTRKNYQSKEVRAAHAVLLELTHMLGEYRDDIVLVGGWVPELLLPNSKEPHVGSTDVDLALNHKHLQDAGYRTIHELLLGRKYRPGKQPFIFHRTVDLEDGEQVVVQVDFLSGEYEGTGDNHRHQKVQELLARKVRGCDMAFEKPVEITIEGVLPGGGKDTAKVRVASIVPFLMMKAIAMKGRLKEKDAWDVYYCVKNYPGGADALAEEFKSHLQHGVVQEGLTIFAEKFASTGHVGCQFVADFEELNDPEEITFLKRDVFERIERFLKALGRKA